MAYPSASARSKDWGTEILTDADLESEFDLLHDYINAALNSSSGHKHDATTSEGPKILTANIDDAAGTAGDIYTNTGGTTVGRLALGTANQVLAVNSGATAVEYQTVNADQSQDGSIVQVVNTSTGAVSTGTTTIPLDDTIPQNTEGDQVMTLAITPSSTTNKLKIDVVVHAATSGNNSIIAALFQDSTANALGSAVEITENTVPMALTFTHFMTAATTSATTFKVRVGPDTAATVTFNGRSSARLFGGVFASSITITEIKGS